MHGVICETTKLGNANTDACDLTMNSWNEVGSFSFTPGNFTGNEIRCSRSLKPGFWDITLKKEFEFQYVKKLEFR